MAVTNLVKEQNDHVLRIAQFAKDAILAASETLIDLEDPELGYVKIRVGFHSGPVVANVIGNRRPKFTIIGDTVNCASRMESNSLPSKIQCSESSALILQEKHLEIPITCRGSIPIKGKGEMTTYFVYSDEIDSLLSTMNKINLKKAAKFNKQISDIPEEVLSEESQHHTMSPEDDEGS